MTKPDMTAQPPLCPERLPPPIIEPVADALIVPVEQNDGLGCGVFRPDGSFCELSRTRLSANRFTAQPVRPDRSGAKPLQGTYLYGGLGRHHFGHFLMESIARIWAMDGRHDQFDGLIMLPFMGTDFGSVLRRRLLAFFELMGVDIPVHLVKTPVITEQLMIPAQGFGHLQWTTGNEEFRQYVRAHLAANCPAQGPEKIYISRSRLKHAHQRVDQEDRIEAMMQAAGYTIFHPQRHSIMAQARVYRAAKVIVGADGSAFHLVPFAVTPETRLALIQRRGRQDAFDAIVNQISAFADVDLTVLNPLSGASAPHGLPEPIEFKRLRHMLDQAGYV